MLLLNLLEELKSENSALQAQVQQLRDEINRLKGEQAKPNIKPNKKKTGDQESPTDAATTDHNHKYSSESQRKTNSTSKSGSRKKSKRDQIKIDREVILDIDPDTLPLDAQFKGHQEVIVQDIKVESDNVLFKKAKYYSPSTGRTYLAELPAGYQAQGDAKRNVNQDAINYLEKVSLAKSKVELIKRLPHDKDFNEREFISLLEQAVPNLGPRLRFASPWGTTKTSLRSSLPGLLSLSREVANR